MQDKEKKKKSIKYVNNSFKIKIKQTWFKIGQKLFGLVALSLPMLNSNTVELLIIEVHRQYCCCARFILASLGSQPEVNVPGQSG